MSIARRIHSDAEQRGQQLAGFACERLDGDNAAMLASQEPLLFKVVEVTADGHHCNVELLTQSFDRNASGLLEF